MENKGICQVVIKITTILPFTMKISFLAGMLVAIGCSPALSAQTFFTVHAGSDGVGVDVSNVNSYFPVMVAPSPPVHAVHVPLMPGYYPEPVGKRYKKAAKEYRKAAKHYRKAVEYGRGMHTLPAGFFYYDADDYDDYDDYYEDYYKRVKKAAKKHHKYYERHDKHKHKHHRYEHHQKHRHHDD